MTKDQKRDLIVSLVERWVGPMHLGGWRIGVSFPSRIKEVASCESQPEYLTAALYFNLKRVPDTEEAIRELVAHEMAHPHVEALAELANRGARRTPERREAIRIAEEHLTTVVSRMILPHLP